MKIKQCIRCREVKPTTEYYLTKTGDGFSAKCKKCCHYYQLDYAIKNADRIKAYQKEYSKKRRKKNKKQHTPPNNFYPIPGYPNYFVSPESQQIWSKKCGRLLAAVKVNNGYLATHIVNEDGKKMVLVHRILAQQFISNPNNLPCVNHKNGNKHDNSVENLEWVSYQDNVRHAMMLGLIKPKRKGYKRKRLTKEQVLEIKKNPEGLTQQQLADKFGVVKNTISVIHQGRRWKNV